MKQIFTLSLLFFGLMYFGAKPIVALSKSDSVLIKVDISPNFKMVVNSLVHTKFAKLKSSSVWEVQFEHPVAVGEGEAGIETDGKFLYTTKWNGDKFYQYTLDGVFVEEFTIEGVSEVRDLAYDGQYMYGGNASTTIFMMDFDNRTLVESYTTPVPVRAIAYNDDHDSFYANNWSSDVVEFNRNGELLSSFSVGEGRSYYGFAYDNWSEGGPFLWGYSQDGESSNTLVKMILPEGNELEETYDLGDIISTNISGDIAGGLFVHTNLVDGSVTLGGLVQNKVLWGLELASDTVAPVIVCKGGIPSSNLMLNGSFEEGDLTGWEAINNSEPFIPFDAYSSIDGNGFFPAALPTAGDLLGGNGFDGGSGDAILYQTVDVPLGVQSAVLSWDENIDYNLVDFCSDCEERIYEVQIRDASGNVLEVIHQVTALGGTIDEDNEWSSHLFNATAYQGQTIQLAFWQHIPEDHTGPAKFALDNVKLEVSSGTVVNLDETGKVNVKAEDLIESVEEAGEYTLTIESTLGDSIDFSCDQIGRNLVKVIATDEAGNTSSCDAEVIVQDIIKPVAICQDLTVYLDEAGHAEIDGFMIDNGSYDACGIRIPLLSKKHFFCKDLGENTVTLTVNDFYGNYDFCEAVVTVLDTISPAIETLDDMVVWAEVDACSAVVEFSTPLASDACGVEVVQTSGLASGSEFPAGTTEVVFTAADNSGNTSESRFMVTVETVNKAPEFTAIAAQEVPSYAGMLSIPLSGITFGADCQEQEVVSVTATSEDTDLLSSVEVDYTAGESNGMLHLYYTAGVSGSTLVTVTVQDDGGTANGGTDVFEQSFEVTITANQAPELTGELDTIYVDKNANYTATLPAELFVDADAGDVLSYSLSLSDESVLPDWVMLNAENMEVSVAPTADDLGEHKFLLTASDQLGATADVELVVVVQIPTGIEDLNQTFDLVVYPNPSKGKVYVRALGADFGESTVFVRTITGQEVYRQDHSLTTDLELDLSQELEGFYFITVQSEKLTMTKKVILRK